MNGSGPADLMAQVQAYLQQVYAGPDSTPDSLAQSGIVLAFENIGMPISQADFRLNPDEASSPPSAAMGVQRTSQYSNFIPLIEASVVQYTDRTLEDQYGIILEGSQPAPNTDAAALGAIKNPAVESFQNAAMNALAEGVSQFRPVEATPTDWYDVTNTSNWTTHSFSVGQPAPTGAPAPASTSNVPPFVWHVLPVEYRPLVLQHPLLFQPSPVATHVALSPAAIEIVRPETTPPSEFHPAITELRPMTPAYTAKPPAATMPAESLSRVALMPGYRTVISLSNQSTPQSVQTNQLTVTFDYCLVRLARSWLSAGFLSSRSWFLPGYRAQDLSTGNDLTGKGNFSLTPIGFIAIKALAIVANWTANDVQAAQTSLGLSSFSLVGSSFDAATNSLTCPGIQIIAWVCEAQPPLPPVSDPSLAPASAASSASSAASSSASSASSDTASTPSASTSSASTSSASTSSATATQQSQP